MSRGIFIFLIEERNSRYFRISLWGSLGFDFRDMVEMCSSKDKYLCMKNCAKCNKEFPNRILVDGKYRNTQRRKYCLECSPFGDHNTIKLEKGKSLKTDYEYQKKRGFKRKCELVLLKGGCCSLCGYDKNLSALEFHHKNPSEKISQLDIRVLTNRTWDFILKEADKCILICSNCHSEHHNPSLSDWKMSQVGIEPTLQL